MYMYKEYRFDYNLVFFLEWSQISASIYVVQEEDN